MFNLKTFALSQATNSYLDLHVCLSLSRITNFYYSTRVNLHVNKQVEQTRITFRRIIPRFS